MKIIASLLLGLYLAFAAAEVGAQHRKLTVILFRHAEKDLSEDANAADPELSAAGKRRAEKLVRLVNKYRPDAIYSTDYIRTRATVRPLARSGKHMVLMYDPRNLTEMRDMILSGKLKRVVVVGHNTTTPALANLLLGQEKYKPLAESEYDKMWIIKIKRNKEKPNRVKDAVIAF